jgi:hypothetical protein
MAPGQSAPAPVPPRQPPVPFSQQHTGQALAPGAPPPSQAPSPPAQPYPAYPYSTAPPPPPGTPLKGEPWGTEDPSLWCARQARFHSLWGMLAISIFLLGFGLGCYIIITAYLYEGEEGGSQAWGGFLLLVLSPIILTIVGAVAAFSLFRTGRRMRGRAGAPEGLGWANLALGFATLLWALLIFVFIGLATIKSGENGDFPLGMFAYAPVYMGLCTALTLTGSSLLAWSSATRLESGLVMLLGWGALFVFMLSAIIINPDNITPDEYEKLVFWLRFGPIIASILPFFSIIGILYAHGRRLRVLEGEVVTGMPASMATPGQTDLGACPGCGARRTVHPRTRELFCPACGYGLPPEPDVLWPPQ